MEGQEVPLLELLEGLMTDIGQFIEEEKSHPHNLPDEQSEVADLEKKLETLEKELDELKKEADDFDKKTSSSRDARKMFGDVAPGDTTHQDVVLLYQNYFKMANRSLPKELNMKEESSEGKFRVWRMISEIIQESFSNNQIAIIDKIKEKLKGKLEEKLPASKTLDEATSDLLRAFHMYVQESGQLEKVKEKLKETEGADSVTEIDQAADIILKLDPECYYSFYHDEDKALDDSLLVTTTESSSSASLPRTGEDKKKGDKINDSQTLMVKKGGAKLAGSSHSDKKKGLSAIFGGHSNNTPKQRDAPKQLPPTEIPVQAEEYDKTIARFSHNCEEKMKLILKKLKSLEDMTLKKNQLRSQIEELECLKQTTEEREHDKHLPRDCCKEFGPDTEKGTLKKWHEKIVEGLLTELGKHFNGLLTCSSDIIIEDGADTREKYKIYGLLLSACSIGKENPAAEGIAKEVFDHVIDAYKVTEVGGIVMKHVKEAVDLTYNMLTLLPPLVVTVCPQKYKEEVHDTNSSTWDESAALDSSRKLTYYRPILVYGNQLHVAVKGLVGNTEKDH